jgi:hypothetical protein
MLLRKGLDIKYSGDSYDFKEHILPLKIVHVRHDINVVEEPRRICGVLTISNDTLD